MKIERTPPLTPRGSSSAQAEAGDEAGEGRRAEFTWDALVPLVIHPVKVAIVEAMLWIGQPLSAKRLAESFAVKEYYLGVVSHHANELARLGVLEVVETRRVPGRGATEKLLFFAG